MTAASIDVEPLQAHALEALVELMSEQRLASA